MNPTKSQEAQKRNKTMSFIISYVADDARLVASYRVARNKRPRQNFSISGLIYAARDSVPRCSPNGEHVNERPPRASHS